MIKKGIVSLLVAQMISPGFATPAGEKAAAQCLLSFYIKPDSFRGGRVVSDRTILHRKVQFYGRLSITAAGRYSGMYLTRFFFFTPVTPAAARTDGGTAFLTVDSTDRSWQVPDQNADFIDPQPGRIISIYTASRPSFVQLIVKGKATRARSGYLPGQRTGQQPHQTAVSSTSAAAVLRQSLRTGDYRGVMPWFKTGTVFYRSRMGGKRRFNHIQSSTAYKLFCSHAARATSRRISTAYRKISVTLTLSTTLTAVWEIERGFRSWQASRVTLRETVAFPARSLF